MGERAVPRPGGSEFGRGLRTRRRYAPTPPAPGRTKAAPARAGAGAAIYCAGPSSAELTERRGVQPLRLTGSGFGAAASGGTHRASHALTAGTASTRVTTP